MIWLVEGIIAIALGVFIVCLLNKILENYNDSCK